LLIILGTIKSGNFHNIILYLYQGPRHHHPPYLGTNNLHSPIAYHLYRYKGRYSDIREVSLPLLVRHFRHIINICRCIIYKVFAGFQTVGKIKRHILFFVNINRKNYRIHLYQIPIEAGRHS
jgi:hypothetical protein